MQELSQYDNYHDIINELYSLVPKFKKIVESSVDENFYHNPYLVFGPLGKFLVDQILLDNDNHTVDRIYLFINKLFEGNATDSEHILSVTFFENLTDYKISIAVSKQKLKGKALLLFNIVLNGPIFAGGMYAK